MPRFGNSTLYPVVVQLRADNQVGPGVRAAQTAIEKSLRDEIRASEQANRAMVAMERQTHREAMRILAQKDAAIQRSIREQERATKTAAANEIKEATRSAREVQRINSQTARQAEQNARLQERAAKSLADHKQKLIQQEQATFLRAEAQKTAAAQAAAASQSRAIEATKAVAIASWNAIKLAAVAAFAGILAAGAGLGVVISKAMSFDVLERGLEVVAGTAEAAKKQLLTLKELARLPGLGLREAIQASIQLQIGLQNAVKDTGIRLSLTETIIRQFSNAIALTGGGPEVFQAVINQIVQMSSAGKVLMADLRPIITQAPALGQALLKAFGTISPEEINALGLSTEEFLRRWAAAAAEAARAPNSAANAWTNFTTAFDLALVKLGKPFLAPLTKALNFLEPLLDSLGTKAGEVFTRIGEDLTKLWDDLPSATRSAFADMLSTVEQLGGQVRDWFVENYPLILQAVTNTLNKIALFWNLHKDEIKEIASGTLKSVLEIVQSLLQVMAGHWDEGWKNLGTAIERNGPAIKAAAKAAIQLIVEAIIESKALIAKAAIGLGEAIAEGTWNGVKNSATAGKIYLWAFGLAQSARNSLLIRSPSQVFFRIGVDIAKGLELGIQSGTDATQQALQRLTIPSRPETVSGKGSSKINAARRKADEANRPGFDLLEQIYQDVDQLAPAEQKTKLLSVQAALATERYRELKPAIREALLAAAEFFDNSKAQFSVGDALNEQLDQTAKRMLELTHPLKENASAVEKFDLWLTQLRADSPATAKALDSQAAAVLRVRDAWATVDEQERERRAQAAWKKVGTGLGSDMLGDAEGLNKKTASDYASIIDSLNGKLGERAHQTEVQITLDRLHKAGIDDITSSQAQQALAIAATIDQQTEMQKTREQLSEFADDVGSIFGRAADLWNGSFKDFFSDVKRGFGDMLRQMVGDLLQSKIHSLLKDFLEGIFGVKSSQSAQSSSGSILSKVFGGGGTTGTPPFSGFQSTPASSGTTWGNFKLPGIDAASGPGASGGSALSRVLQSMGLPSGGGTGTASGSAGGLGGFGGMMAGKGMLGALGGMLPLLGVGAGLGLGVAAGGQSGAGQVLGGIGGAALGGALGLLGFTALGGTFASPALVAMLGVLGPAALIAGPILIAGAIILAKNKARQEAEKVRNTAGIDARTAVYNLLWEAQNGDMTVAHARAQFEEIHQNYLGKVSGIKDAKTKRNALLWWDHISGAAVDPGGATTALWPLIEAAAKESEKRGNIRGRMSPVFASGGTSQRDQLIKVTPGEGLRYPGSNVVHTVFGQDRGYDSEYMYAPRGTRILNKSEMRTAEPHAYGGYVGGPVGSEGVDFSVGKVEVFMDSDMMATVVFSDPRFKKAVTHTVRIAKKEKRLA